MNYLSQFRGLPKQVYILCLVRWITGMGRRIQSAAILITVEETCVSVCRKNGAALSIKSSANYITSLL